MYDTTQLLSDYLTPYHLSSSQIQVDALGHTLTPFCSVCRQFFGFIPGSAHILQISSDNVHPWPSRLPLVSPQITPFSTTQVERCDVLDCSGKLDRTDSQPKDWKRNFRCALNSLKDVRFVSDRSKKDGPGAFVVYEFLPEQPKKRGITHITMNVTKQQDSTPVFF